MTGKLNYNQIGKRLTRMIKEGSGLGIDGEVGEKKILWCGKSYGVVLMTKKSWY